MERCVPYLDLISQALDGPLSETDRQDLDCHLRQCPLCRELDAQLRQLHDQMAQLPQAEVPEDFTQGVMDRIRALEEHPKVVPLFRRPQFKALLGLAACSALVIGIWSAQPGTPAAPSPASPSGSAPPSITARAKLPDASVPPTAFAMLPADADTLDQDELVRQVRETLGEQPGVVALLSAIPSELADTGRQLTDAQNRTLLVLDRHSPKADEALAHALRTFELGEGPIVLIVWP